MGEPVALNFRCLNDMLGEVPSWLIAADCQEVMTSYTTPQHQDEKWVENFRANLHTGFQLYPRRMTPSEKVGVLIGASPAIARQVDEFRALSRDFVTIPCSVSLRFCIDNNIRVDFCFAVDANTKPADFDCDTENLTLIATPFTNPEALKRWQGNIYFYVPSGGKEYQRLIDEHFQPEDIDIGGGNVVTTSMLWAHKFLRLKHFIFTGMSLCYYGDYYYDARKTISEYEKERWAELKAIDIYGKITKTTMPLLIYKIWLETYGKSMCEISGGSIINATEDGILGVLPEIAEDLGDMKVRFRPKFLPWLSVVPLRVAAKAHRMRIEEIKNGTRK